MALETVERGPNAGLIGQKGGRFALDTPALAVDRPAFDRYHVVEGDTLVEIWPIEARGRR